MLLSRSAAGVPDSTPDAPIALGVDLGGTKVLAALAAAGGGLIAERQEPTDPRGGRHVLRQIHSLAARLCAQAGAAPEQIHSVVLGSPGVVDPGSGAIRLVPNIPGLASFDVARALAALFGQPVLVENDVKLAMLGEAGHGCARGCAHAAFLSMGTGVGLGLMVNGQLLRGATGAAGEIAYLPLGPQADSADALTFGAFEMQAGAAAIVRRYQARAGARAPLVQTVRDLFELVVAGDAPACAVLDETARAVALAITALYAVVDPSIVVLGGSIGSRAELLDRVRSAMASVFSRPVRVEPSALGHRAGLLGAVGLAQQRLVQLAHGTAPADRVHRA